jgi:drug/metabolite transporter, DME family
VPPSTRAGYLYIIAAASLWGSLGVASRGVLRAGVGPLELSFWRASIAGVLFAAQALHRRRTLVAREDRPALAAFAVVGVSIFYLAYLFAVRDGGAALAAILLYTAPAWVAIASALWLHEPMTRRSSLALLLTLAGVACVALGAGGGGGGGGGMHVAPMAIVWGLCSGLAYASYYLFGKRYFGRYEPATLFMYALPLGALLLLPLVHFAPKSAATWGWILFVAVVPTWVALQMYGAGLRRLDATRAVTVATLEPVVAALLAFAVWGELLSPVAYLGGGLVLAGVLVTTSEGPPQQT